MGAWQALSRFRDVICGFPDIFLKNKAFHLDLLWRIWESAVAAGNRLHLQELPEMADSALDPGSRSLFNSVHAMPQDSALPAQPLTPG